MHTEPGSTARSLQLVFRIPLKIKIITELTRCKTPVSKNFNPKAEEFGLGGFFLESSTGNESRAIV